jgi:hypothetical protein
MRARQGALALALLHSVALAACGRDDALSPQRQPRPVVHAVLNPLVGGHSILLERTLTGRVPIRSGEPFDPDEPIQSAGGDPISFARVILSGPHGTIEPVEATRIHPRGKGRGVYVFANGAGTGCPPPPAPCMKLFPGVRYELTVVTPEQQVMRGNVVIPSVVLPPPAIFPEPFDLDADTLGFSWRNVPGAKRFVVQVSTPYEPFVSFTDDTTIRLPGSLRHTNQRGLPLVFLPGFEQTVTIAAVDANYFDYYRSENDRFTGSGIINHLEGGSGVFGAFAPVVVRRYAVRAAEDESIEGEYAPGAPVFGSPLERLQLYVAARAGSARELSGAYTYPGSRYGVVGRLDGARVVLALLRNQSIRDTVMTFSGRVVGSELRVGGSGGAAVVFARR